MLKTKIQVIFFDLDNTLFDHTKAEQETLRQIFRTEFDSPNGVNETDFLTVYDKINSELWAGFSRAEIAGEKLKVLRFEKTLQALNLKHPDYAKLGNDYLEIYSKKKFMIPDAKTLLEYLRPGYELGILSNGFKATQNTKLSSLGIRQLFSHYIFSGDVGVGKPNKRIFEAAQKAAGVAAPNILYIGDSYENDIVGATQVNWHAVYFNPTQKEISNSVADLEIRSLKELTGVL